MNKAKRIPVFVIAALFAGLLLQDIFTSCSPPTNTGNFGVAGPQLSKGDWKVPVNVNNGANASQQDYYNFGWQTFIAINWPANASYRGMPDTTKMIGAVDKNGNPIPVVWEAWQEQYQIFLDHALNPGPWNEPDLGCNGFKLGLKRLSMFAKSDGSEVFDDFNEATGNPLIDQDSQYVRYEVRVCESEYDYFVTNTYYNADSQIVAVQQNRFVGFPKGGTVVPNLPVWSQFGATEVKASWRIFTAKTPASVKNRYYRTMAILTDSKGNCTDTSEVGLIGLHILRLTQTTGSSWYWASFEQVDNLKLQSQYGGTLPAHPTFNTQPAVMYGDSGYSKIPAMVQPGQPLPPAVPVGVSSPPFDQSNPELDAVNQMYTKMLTGTPFQYYQLIGTVNPPSPGQTPVIDSSGNGKYPPVKLNTAQMANSTMETYIVKSNCVTCHIGGYPQLPPNYPTPYSNNYQVFSFLPGLAQTSSSVLKGRK